MRSLVVSALIQFLREMQPHLRKLACEQHDRRGALGWHGTYEPSQLLRVDRIMLQQAQKPLTLLIVAQQRITQQLVEHRGRRRPPHLPGI